MQRIVSNFIVLLASSALICAAGTNVGFSMETQAACTSAKAKKAEEEGSKLNTWADLHKAFLGFKNCDDGSVAEAFDEAVVKLLINGWDKPKAWRRLVTKDTAFRNFVLRHVNETAASEDLLLISSNARNKCPSQSVQSFCEDLVGASEGQK